MRLLIVTQAVDRDDPVLGFFHRWIEEFARHCTLVHVICLREGEHRLPSNVHIHSLGKEDGASRVKYLARFYQYAWPLRHSYDAVFVHMNPEYVVLGGLLWRLMRKRVILWRNHQKPGLIAYLGSQLAHTICYTSPQSYVARFKKAVRMPVGIDTTRFVPGDDKREGILMLGRLDPVKHTDALLEALERLVAEGRSVQADIFGQPTPGNEAYGEALKHRFGHLRGVRFLGSVRHEDAPVAYASHAIYVNLTPAGSFDKTIGEAMAAGCVVVAANDAVKEVIPEGCFVSAITTEAVVRAVDAALNLSSDECARIGASMRSHIEEHHSLKMLVGRIMSFTRYNA